ncbi:ABC transporter substrate-binding protein [Bradyrhizobium sp. GCM10027634]|uniref:ABC transporter substrate-binding protein n=1 Tax=unclassified Bradyrhizobium TaxID=2631580 RepID=UPI00263AF897|nr:ABC transporter substrate-binding protein [Bradyrhizobium sp. WYCCWR 12677]MDN5005484.1 ABC transporter substrate-binding protein [Bradyrhizobium sp. WYCCWR 12677]
MRIGILSDVAGPYSDAGGIGMRIAAELAVEEFGGTVLGRPIEIHQVDHQNKSDIAASQARNMIENLQVDVLTDGGASSSALAIQSISREKEKIFLITSPGTTEFTGAQCSSFGFHFSYDTFALAKCTGSAVMQQPDSRGWYFITVDYAFGHSMERDATRFVKAGGGKVLGSVRPPLNTSDFSSFLLQASSSAPDVIGLAVVGQDLQNCIKQAQEFGITRGRTRLACFLMFVTDVIALGQNAASGLLLTESFYWDMTDQTREWSNRFMARKPKPPTMPQAGNYSAVRHWLKAVDAAGTTEARAVAAKMRQISVDDMYNRDVRIREDGRVLHDMHLFEVKPPGESSGKFDLYRHLATTTGEYAYRPLDEGHCPLINN